MIIIFLPRFPDWMILLTDWFQTNMVMWGCSVVERVYIWKQNKTKPHNNKRENSALFWSRKMNAKWLNAEGDSFFKQFFLKCGISVFIETFCLYHKRNNSTYIVFCIWQLISWLRSMLWCSINKHSIQVCSWCFYLFYNSVLFCNETRGREGLQPLAIPCI